MKVFISAYACEPNLGSEIGVGWHWVLEMSKYFELWVLTRESNRKNIEPWIADHPEFVNIHWLYFDLPRWARWWKKGLRGVRTYYNLWQWLSNDIVKRTMQENDIQVFHHLTYGNALWAVSRYGQKQTFVWGPIGGLETIPAEFSKHYTMKWRVIEAIRRLAVSFLPLNVAFNSRCKNADLILCKTDDTLMRIPKECREKGMLMTDVGVERNENENHNENENDNDGRGGVVRFLTVGRLDAWRGFDLVIEAFAILADEREDVELVILGNGSDMGRLKKLVDGKQCKDKIVFMGSVSQKRYCELMKECDVVVNGALKEGAVTVAFDAIANGKPQVCVESGGYTRILNNEIGEVVKRGGREEVIAGLWHGMNRFCDEKERMNVKDYCLGFAEKLEWKEKGKEIYAIIFGKYGHL